MNKRRLEIARFLSIHNRPMGGKELANALKVTPRPTKNHVHKINEPYGKSIVAFSRSGYELHTNTVPSLLAILDDRKIPQTQKERSFYAIEQFMLHHHSGLSASDLNDMLCVSYSTVKTVIYKVNKIFPAYHIVFPCGNDCVYMQGSEKDRRRLMNYVINEEAKDSYISLDLLRKNSDSIDIDALQIIICQTFKKCTYYLNDLAALNLPLHLLIMIDRKLNEKELNSGQADFTFASSQEEAFLGGLRQQIERRFGIVFDDYEYFELHMLFRASANFSLNVSSTALGNAVGEDVLALAREHVRMIGNLYMTDLSVNTFITLFTLYLKDLIFRAKTGRSIKSPITQATKDNSPIVLDIAIYIALDLMDRYHFMVNEGEIVFLTVYVGAEIERQSASIYEISVILICPNCHGMASGILNIMTMNFGNQLSLISSMTDETRCREKLREQGTAIVFSTIPLIQHACYANSKVVQISLVNLTSQFDRVQSVIPKKLEEGKNQKLCVDFHTLSEKDLFLHEPATASREQILQLLCAALTEEKYVNSDFYNNMCRRENAATAALGGMAIPHAVEADAMKTNIVVAISKNGIQWGFNTVYIVFSLAIDKADKREFRSICESLVSLFSEPAIMPLI